MLLFCCALDDRLFLYYDGGIKISSFKVIEGAN